MKRTFVVLLVLAIGVWSYVTLQVVISLFGSESESAEFYSAPAAWEVHLFSHRTLAATTFRDPFQSYLLAEKPAPPTPVKMKPKIPEAPMTVTVSGIMLGSPPMAILKNGSQTEIVKKGDAAFGYKVTNIETAKVTLQKSGKTYTLSYP